MKSIYVVLKDLREFFVKEYRIFIIITIGLSLSTFSALICANLMIQTQQTIEENKKQDAKRFRLNNIVNNDKEKINRLIDEIIFNSEEELERVFEIYIENVQTEQSVEDIIGYYASEKIYNTNLMAEGRIFSEEELKEDNKVIIMSTRSLDYGEKLSYIGDEINIDNIIYKIIGAQFLWNGSSGAIPYKHYLMNYEFNSITIDFEEDLNEEQRKLLQQKLLKYDINNKFIYKNDPLIMPIKVFFVFIAIGVFFLAILNMMYLFEFILENNKYKSSIYSICGMSRQAYYYINITSVLYIGIIGLLIGAFIYYISLPLLEMININTTIEVSYIIILLVAYFVCMIIGTMRVLKKMNIEKIR